MQRRRTLMIAAVITVMLVVLLVVVSCGFVVLYMRLGQTFSVSQTRPSTATQQTNPGLAALSGTPQTPGATYRRWKLVSFTYDGRQQTLALNITAVFIFDSKGLYVDGHACNAYGETYT